MSEIREGERDRETQREPESRERERDRDIERDMHRLRKLETTQPTCTFHSTTSCTDRSKGQFDKDR